MISLNITSENFNLVAAKFYGDIGATDQDFAEDMRRFSLVKRLFNTYKKSGDLKDRLIMNHIVVLYNVFNDAATPLLFYELKEYLPQLVPFLLVLRRLPDKVGNLYTSTITLDTGVVSCLRKNLTAI